VGSQAVVWTSACEVDIRRFKRSLGPTARPCRRQGCKWLGVGGQWRRQLRPVHRHAV